MSVIAGKNYRTVGTWADYVSLVAAGSSVIATNSRVQIANCPGSYLTLTWNGTTAVTAGDLGIAPSFPSTADGLSVGLLPWTRCTSKSTGLTYIWQSGWTIW